VIINACNAQFFAAIPIGVDPSKYKEWLKGLKKYHDRHFLIWNFTDPDKRKFESKDFDDQVGL
jgi:hypothetical protein